MTRQRLLAGLFIGLALLAPSRGAAWDPLRSPDPDVQRGNERMRAGDPEGALRAYDRAAERLGDDPTLALDRGLALMALGRGEEARAAFARAARPDAPADVRAEALYDLGLMAHREGTTLLEKGQREQALQRFGQAAQAYRAALRLRPGHRGAAWNLEVLRRAVQPPTSQPPSPPQPKRSQGQPPPDAGAPDGGSGDGGRASPPPKPSDGGVGEGGRSDGGQPPPASDAGASADGARPRGDASVADGGASPGRAQRADTDGGRADGGVMDAGARPQPLADGGVLDAGAMDAGRQLGEVGDAGSRDAGAAGRDGTSRGDGGTDGGTDGGAAAPDTNERSEHEQDLPDELRRLLDALQRQERGLGRWRRNPLRRERPEKPW